MDLSYSFSFSFKVHSPVIILPIASQRGTSVHTLSHFMLSISLSIACVHYLALGPDSADSIIRQFLFCRASICILSGNIAVVSMIS